MGQANCVRRKLNSGMIALQPPNLAKCAVIVAGREAPTGLNLKRMTNSWIRSLKPKPQTRHSLCQGPGRRVCTLAAQIGVMPKYGNMPHILQIHGKQSTLCSESLAIRLLKCNTASLNLASGNNRCRRNRYNFNELKQHPRTSHRLRSPWVHGAPNPICFGIPETVPHRSTRNLAGMV